VVYPVSELRAFAAALLHATGLSGARAEAVAAILVEGDLLGHDTHGMALLPIYLREIESGSMRIVGEPDLLSDAGAAVTWDGCRLPGPWLVLRALDLAAERAARYGVGTVVIKRSHHIACLATYLLRASERGLVMTLMSSAPSTATVAPHGGTRGVLSPNPVACGFPTGDSAVLVDVSTSSTSNSLVHRLQKSGQRLPHPWLVDRDGHPTDDPAALADGAILPLGGIDSGHKGYGLSLMVEALTSGLAGHGRADAPEGMGANVFLQVFDPGRFGGLDAFRRQMQWTESACIDGPSRSAAGPVRMPGQGGLARRERQLRDGVHLESGTMEELRPWQEKLGVPLPKTLPI